MQRPLPSCHYVASVPGSSLAFVTYIPCIQHVAKLGEDPRNDANFVTISAFVTLYIGVSPFPAIQWFGIDIGGTLVKSVYFETQEENGELEGKEGEGVSALRNFVKSNLKYGSSGMRDWRLEMPMQTIGGQTGTLHFIKFATSRMDGFFDMVTENGLGRFAKVVCATGGGAFKFETAFKEVSLSCVSCRPTCVKLCTLDVHVTAM